jgi:heavy metal sensor kinase
MSFNKTKKSQAFLTIGMRLTLWGTVVTSGICMLICTTLYLGLTSSLYGEVDRFLEGEILEFKNIVDQHGTNLEKIQEEIREELGSRPRTDLTFRLLDADGRLLVTSNPRDDFPKQLAPIPSDEGKSEIPYFQTLVAPGTGHSARFCSRWITLPGGGAHIAQATYLLDRVEHSIRGFRRSCLLALLLSTILAFLGGYWLSKRSLSQVGQMTKTARNIGAGTLSERIGRSENGDELDELADTLNQMLGRIESQVLQIQQFTADAAHELRTPLAALRGHAELALSKTRSVEDLRRVLEESLEYFARLSRLTDDLLLLARADAGRLVLQSEAIRLDQIAGDVVDLYAASAAEQGIELGIVENHNVWVHGDDARIAQLIGNVLDNAIKYIGKGGHIRVRIHEENATAQVIVADDGPGIAPEALPHIFDRFFRADRSRSAATSYGAGLGLAICQSIARLHGGLVEIKSDSDSGTEVTIRLPAIRQTDTGRAGAEHRAATATGRNH